MTRASGVDRILEVIDVGPQHAGDVAYDWDTGACLRCGMRAPAEGSAWCDRCRPGPPTPEQIQAAAAAMPALAHAFEALAAALAAALRAIGPHLAETLAAIEGAPGKAEPDPMARALARKHRPFTCPRHGGQPGGFCRTCSRGG
jgi:hypothetical protein